MILKLTFFYFLFGLLKTYARPEAIKAGQAKYAASITGNILAFYESPGVFKMNYPLSKLGMYGMIAS